MVKSNGLYQFAAFFIGLSLMCLNLSQAQTSDSSSTTPSQSPAPQPAGPNITITTTPPVPVPSPNAAATPSTTPNPAATPGGAGTTTVNGVPAPNTAPVNVDGLLNSNSSPGKYAEYQSICRTHEFDEKLYQPDDVVNKIKADLRSAGLELLNNKDKTVPKNTYKTLKGLIDYGETDMAQDIIKYMKTKSLAGQDANLLNAFNALQRRSLSAARQLLVKVLSEDDSNEFIMTVLGEIYMSEKNYYEASTVYEDLNKKTRDQYLPQLCEATVLNSFNAEGEKVCMMAAKKFRDNPFPLIYAGISVRERLDNRKATAYFRLSLKTRPTEMGHICLAEISLIEKKIDDAIESFKLSSAVAPKSPRALLGLAAAQMSAHKYDDAYEVYRKICKLNPRYEIEIRKAYKKLTEEKIPSAERFMRLAETCAN